MIEANIMLATERIVELDQYIDEMNYLAHEQAYRWMKGFIITISSYRPNGKNIEWSKSITHRT